MLNCGIAKEARSVELTEVQQQELERLVRELALWLRANGHPHLKIVIDSDGDEQKVSIRFDLWR
jgi:hypothetical protein